MGKKQRVSGVAATEAAERLSPAVLANAFARAASGDSTKGGHARGGRGGATGVGSNSISGGLEARYYFEDGSGKAHDTAVTALTEDQVCTSFVLRERKHDLRRARCGCSFQRTNGND